MKVRAFLILFIGFISCNICAAPLFETLQDDRKGRKLSAVVLRDASGKYTLATPEGIQILSKSHVRRYGGFSPEISRLNDLFGSIENWIRLSRFPQALEKLPELDKALTAFDKAADRILKSSATPAAFSKSLVNAKAYYTNQRESIKPTIKTLELSRALKKSVTDMDGTKAFNPDAFLSLLKTLKKLQGITKTISLAEQEKKDAIELAKEKQAEVEAQLLKVATQGIAVNWDISKTTRILGTLKSSSVIAPELSAMQTAIAAALTADAATFFSGLNKIVRNSYLFNNGPTITRTNLQMAEKKSRSINSALSFVSSKMFGDPGKKASDSLLSRINANRAALKEAQGLYNSYQALSNAYLNISSLSHRRLYDDAIKAADAVRLQAQTLGVLDKKFNDDLTKKINEYRGQAFLTALRNPGNMSPKEITRLSEKSDRFYASFHKDTSLSIPFDEIKKRSDELKRYLTFEAILQEIVPTSTVENWIKLKKLNSLRIMITDRETPVHAIGKTTYNTFLGTQADDLYQAAAADFNKKTWDLATEDKQQVFLMIIKWQHAAGRAESAAESIGIAYDHIKGQSNTFAEQLVKLDVSGALAVSTKDLDKSAAIFNRIRTRYPDIFKQYNMQDRLLEVLRKQAKAHEKAGELDRAVNALERICRTGPDFASRNGIFVDLFKLLPKHQIQLLTNGDLRRKKLEAYTKDYGYRMRDVELLKQESQAIMVDFLMLWDAEQAPDKAVDFLIKMSTDYPHLIKESKLNQGVFKEIRQRVFKLRQKLGQGFREDSDIPTVTVPNRLLVAVEKMMIPEFRYFVEKHHLDSALVELKKAKALEFIALGSFSKAFEILKDVQTKYPTLSQRYQVNEMMEEKRQDLWLEKLRTPLGIRSKREKSYGDVPALFIDAGALLFWVIFYLVYLINAVSRGRQYKQLGYSLKHYMVVLGAFLLFLTLFVGVGNMNHLYAACLALIIPTVVFNLFAMASYSFFPLVYMRRFLGIQRAIIAIPGFGKTLTGLKDKVARQEADLNLLADPWAFRIEQLGRLKNIEQAILALRKIVKKIDACKTGAMKDKRPRALFLLGDALFKVKKYDEAESILTQFTEIETTFVDAHSLLGEIKYIAGNYESAIPHLKHCLAELGGDDQIWFKLGRCYFETGKFKSAFKCFDAISAPERDAIFFKARCLARIGDLDQSVNCYQELLKDDPGDGRILYSLASSFAMLGQDVKAFKVINLIKDDNEFFPHALGLQGSILLRNAKEDKAQEFFQKALALNPQLIPALHGLGQLKMEDGELDGAAELFQKVLDLEPFNSAAAFHLGAVKEKKGEENAIDLYVMALEDPQLQPLASIHVARLKFKEAAYKEVTRYYANAHGIELSPYDLYMNGFSGIETGNIEATQTSVDKLVSLLTQPGDAAPFATKALATLAQKLMAVQEYKLAIKCLSALKTSARLDGEDSNALAILLSEASFRTAYDLLSSGKTDKAELMNNTLVKLPEALGFDKVSRFQRAMITLKQQDYAAALETLTSLNSKFAEEPRILYHMAVVYLATGASAQAAGIISSLDKRQDLPLHIHAGMAMIRAYMLADIGKIKDAEQVLANLPPLTADQPGGAYLQSKILLTRADYLCRIHDSTRLQFLLGDMDESSKAHVAYLQAVAALDGGGQISNVVKNLRPFAEVSDDNKVLYSLLTTKLARQMIEDENYERALDILTDLKDPQAAILAAIYHMKMGSLLADLDQLDSVKTALEALEAMGQSVDDSSLAAIIIHNMYILKLKYPILLEEQGTPGAAEAWDAFRDFEKSYLQGNRDYWNCRLARLCSDTAQSQSFVTKEIDHILSEFHTSVLLPTYIGSALACLQEDSLDTLNRHVSNIITLGKAENKVKEFTQRLGITAKHYSESLKKDDPLMKTWGFVIGYLMIQITVREAVNPGDRSPLRPQLESYLEVREHYATPTEFLQARKVFNTRILDALQKGIEGKFTKSGEMLEKCISKIPHGVKLDQQLEASLWTLREQARKPGSAAEQGINISQEFERIYQRVLNVSVQRGS